MLYEGRTVWITSRRQAVEFRALVGSKSLTPIVDMIESVSVWYEGLPEDGRSWSRILRGLPPNKYRIFYIGVSSSSLPGGMRLGSPDWDLPRTLPCSFTPYRELHLSGVRFASLSDVRRFLRHFTRLERLTIELVKWDKSDWHPRAQILPHTLSPSLRHIGIRRCPNPVPLWQLVYESQQCTVLHALSPDDQQAILQVVTSAYAAVKEITLSEPSIEYTSFIFGECNLQMTTLPQVTKDAGVHHSSTIRFQLDDDIELYLICQSQEHNTASAINSPQVIGCVLMAHGMILPGDEHEDERRAYAEHGFWSSVLQLPHLRTLVFGMAHGNAHEMLASAHPELRQLSNQIAFCRFVSLENIAGDEEKWVARDPSSLDTTGRFVPPRMHASIRLMSKRIQGRPGNARNLTTALFIVMPWCAT